MAVIAVDLLLAKHFGCLRSAGRLQPEGLLESICGLALNLGKVKFAELVTVPAQRAGCVTPSDNAVLMRTARGFCPSVVLLMLKLEFLSYSGNTEGMWCVFQYVNAPSP